LKGENAVGGENTENKRLKIAMFGHKRVPSREGGIEIVVEELTSRMVAEGHSVTCYNRRGHHVSGAEFDGEKLSKYKGIKIKTVPTINRKGLAAMTSSFFAAVKVAFGDYDVAHIHAEGPAAMCWIPKLCGKRVIVTIHGACEIIGTTGKKPEIPMVLAA
jgi:glycosyltransferase involved in cell wall biosynthesis